MKKPKNINNKFNYQLNIHFDALINNHMPLSFNTWLRLYSPFKFGDKLPYYIFPELTKYL